MYQSYYKKIGWHAYCRWTEMSSCPCYWKGSLLLLLLCLFNDGHIILVNLESMAWRLDIIRSVVCSTYTKYCIAVCNVSDADGICSVSLSSDSSVASSSSVLWTSSRILSSVPSWHTEQFSSFELNLLQKLDHA